MQYVENEEKAFTYDRMTKVDMKKMYLMSTL
jgi:hypothetical protein